MPFEGERAQDDQRLKFPIRLEGAVPSLPARRGLFNDHTVQLWVLLVLDRIVGTAFLLGKIPR